MDRRSKYKLFTDPIHGFISVPKGTVLRLLDHPYVQRLRRIRQLGLGFLVFPGAEHSRFSHALGALGLMQQALESLREKGTTISFDEAEAACIGILLHDIGHGPFSHTLEQTFLKDFRHEMMTQALMEALNEEFKGALEMAISIFNDQYKKKFFHQLISSQLDIDRLDYLKRDSTHTGVYEGSIGIDRILRTMRVFKGSIVIEQKGIYAVENYLISRKLMYLQVYQHKTVISADHTLHAIFNRARKLLLQPSNLGFPSASLQYFLEQQPSAKKGISQKTLQHYVNLDDNDVLMAVKLWSTHTDPILRDLCHRFMYRKLFRCQFLEKPLDEEQFYRYKLATKKVLLDAGLPNDDDTLALYLHHGYSKMDMYNPEKDHIWILNDRFTQAREFSTHSEINTISDQHQPTHRAYIVHLKDLRM
jgi:hypothetical protein